jgi:hypothetical protein
MQEARITDVRSSVIFFILSINIVLNKDSCFVTRIVPENFEKEKTAPENENDTAAKVILNGFSHFPPRFFNILASLFH